MKHIDSSAKNAVYKTGFMQISDGYNLCSCARCEQWKQEKSGQAKRYQMMQTDCEYKWWLIKMILGFCCTVIC